MQNIQYFFKKPEQYINIMHMLVIKNNHAILFGGYHEI